MGEPPRPTSEPGEVRLPTAIPGVDPATTVYLAAIGRRIASSLDLNETLQQVVQDAVDHLGFGAAVINLVRPDSMCEVVAAAGPPEASTACSAPVPQWKSGTRSWPNASPGGSCASSTTAAISASSGRSPAGSRPEMHPPSRRPGIRWTSCWHRSVRRTRSYGHRELPRPHSARRLRAAVPRDIRPLPDRDRIAHPGQPASELTRPDHTEVWGRVHCTPLDRPGETGPGLILAQIEDITNGHAAGDQLLAGIARALQRSIEDTDTVGRLGGDEFVVIAWPVHRPDEAT